ncbi:MFS transporter [candidate division KSB1 bacterium]|nr:MFS transporter [candidate division KSB1 bacterium]
MRSESNTFASAIQLWLQKARDTRLPRPFIISNIYFFYYLALSIWLPFFNIYLLDQGFSGSQVGVMTGLYQAMLFVVVPIWGMLADRFGNRMALHIALFGAMILVWHLRFIPTFYLFVFYMTALAFLHHPIGMLTDSLAITYVRHSRRVSFGQLRVWGSVSWAIGTVIMGRFLLTHETATVFRMAPAIYGLTWIILWLYQKPADASRVRVSFSMTELKEIFANKRIVTFLLLLALIGIGISPIYVFINFYYRDIGASNQLIGFGFALMALSEVPFFFIAGGWVRRFGAPQVLLTAIGIAVIRLGLYGFISSPIIAVLLGLVQGLTFSLFWVSVVEIMHDLVPEKYRATAQSLIWAFHSGAGVTIGNMCIGRLSDFLAMQKVMLMASAFTALAFICLLLYFRSLGKKVSAGQ